MIIGCLIGLWTSAALIGGIVAAGMITPLHTLVDYYTHIKGI